MLIEYFLVVPNIIHYCIYSLCGFSLRNLKQYRYVFCTGSAKHFAGVPGKGVPVHRMCSSTQGKGSKRRRERETQHSWSSAFTWQVSPAGAR